MRMLLQHLAQRFAQDAHAAAVHDADARQAGEEGAVDETFDFAAGLVDGLADDVDLAGRVRALALVIQRHGDSAGASRFYRRFVGLRLSAGEDLGNVVAGDFHFHRAHLDFEMLVIDFAHDTSRTSGGLELDGVALGYVFHQLGLGVRVALVGSGRVRDYGGVELLAEFAAQFGDAALGVFGKLLGGGAILDGVDGFAGVVFEVAQKSFELLLHFANFGLLLFFSFHREVGFLALQILLAGLEAQTFGFGFAQVGVKSVEELTDVASLRAQARARAFDDRGIQSQTLRDVDSGRRAGDADFQFVGGLQRSFVKSDRRVEHAGRIRGVDLERGVMRGDDGYTADVGEVAGNGDGESGAFFGIGGRAEFVEEHKRVRGGGARNGIDVGDVGGKGGKILLDRLVVADVGENGVEDGEFGAVGGDGKSGLGHQREQADGFQGDGFAAGVGAGDDELAAGAFEFDGDGDDGRIFQF